MCKTIVVYECGHESTRILGVRSKSQDLSNIILRFFSASTESFSNTEINLVRHIVLFIFLYVHLKADVGHVFWVLSECSAICSSLEKNLLVVQASVRVEYFSPFASSGISFS